MMCGRELRPAARPSAKLGEPLLALDHVSTHGAHATLRDISLTLRAGEIVGVAGVSGDGQRELADVVAGVLVPVSGSIAIMAERIEAPSPRQMQAHGVGRVPEDRMTVGMIGALPLAEEHGIALDRSAALQPAWHH